MRNAWLNQLRHKNSGPLFVDLEAHDPQPSRRERARVRTLFTIKKLEPPASAKAIESLPDAYREIIVLRDIEGFTYQEIAMVLNCPAGTVMSRLGACAGNFENFFRPGKPRAGPEQSETDGKVRRHTGKVDVVSRQRVAGRERATVEAHLSECDSCASFFEKVNFSRRRSQE